MFVSPLLLFLSVKLPGAAVQYVSQIDQADEINIPFTRYKRLSVAQK